MHKNFCTEDFVHPEYLVTPFHGYGNVAANFAISEDDEEDEEIDKFIFKAHFVEETSDGEPFTYTYRYIHEGP